MPKPTPGTATRPQMYFVCDRKEHCRAVVLRSPGHAAVIACEYFEEEEQRPADDTVTVHGMKPPDDGRTGVILIWAAIEGTFVQSRSGGRHPRQILRKRTAPARA